MQIILTIVHVLVSLFMILVILLQAGRGGGLVGGGGGGGSTSVGSRSGLETVTRYCAAIFMVTSLSLAYLSSRSDSMVAQAMRAKQEKADAEAKKPVEKEAPKAAEPAPAPAPAPTPEAAPAPAAP